MAWAKRDRPKTSQVLALRIAPPFAVASGLAACALIGITLLPPSATTELLATLVRAGALVFGGGHVVLPLLQSLVRDHLVDERMFFAGYGAAQAMPGPLFSSPRSWAMRTDRRCTPRSVR